MRPSIQPQPKKKTLVSDKATEKIQVIKSILGDMSDTQLTELLSELNSKPIFKHTPKYSVTQQRVKIVHTCGLCGSVQIEHTMIDRLGIKWDDSERVILATRSHCPECVERLMLEEKNMLVVKLLSLVDKYDKKV